VAALIIASTPTTALYNGLVLSEGYKNNEKKCCGTCIFFSVKIIYWITDIFTGIDLNLGKN
jgi:hypothetical protein